MASLLTTYKYNNIGGVSNLSWFHYFVLFTLSLVTISVAIMAFYYKSRLRGMAGMVLSMAGGTNVGLTAGILFGSLFKGDLFYSTVYSILVGILAGTACGLVLGILPSLEGFMAGLMGGMMGAMLGEMIGSDQSVIMINLFLTLSVSTLFLFPILSVPSKIETQNPTRKWLFKPILAFLFLSAYLLWGSQANTQMNISKPNSTDEDGHISHNGQTVKKENQQLELTVSISPSQFSYNPSKIVLKKGQEVSLILENSDIIDHDIEIKHIPLGEKKAETHEGHSDSAENADFHLHASAKSQSKLTFTPLQTGTYEFYCTIPGHREKGMTGYLVIT